MTKTGIFGETLYDIIMSLIQAETMGYAQGGKLALGGTEGDDGGDGGPPREIVGQLPQYKVTYDTTEAATPQKYGESRSGWENSLLDNLNHIRYWEQPARWFEPIFSSGSFDVTINSGVWWSDTRTYIDFDPADVTITFPNSLPRIDVVYVNIDGIPDVSTGEPAVIPSATYPTEPHLPIAEIYLKASGDASVESFGISYTYQSGIAQGYLLRDVRPFLVNLQGRGADYTYELLDVTSSYLPEQSDILIFQSGIGLYVPSGLVLDLLKDVTVTLPSGGQALVYDSGLDQWVASGVITTVAYLDNLLDVEVPSPSDDQILTFSGSTWIAKDLTVSGGATTFLQLTDTPGSYTGQSLRGILVTSGEAGLEFTDIATQEELDAQIAKLDITVSDLDTHEVDVDAHIGANYYAALAGSQGSPSVSNTYLTEDDAPSTPAANRVVRLDGDGDLVLPAAMAFIGDTANSNMTVGLTINQGVNDDEIFTLKASEVDHGITNLTESDTYFRITKGSPSTGIAMLDGLSEGSIGILFRGFAVTDITTKTTGASGYLEFRAEKKTGVSWTTAGADANLLVIRNHLTTRFIFDAEGSAHADVEWTTFDEYDDVALLADFETAMIAERDPLKRDFAEFLRYNRSDLERVGIVHFDDENPGHAMVNTTRLSMLLVGAIQQLSNRLNLLEVY